jgi:hypothetical protein
MNKERVGSLIFLLTGIYGFILSIQLPLGKLNEPGPGVLPLGLSTLLGISGFLWFALGKGGGGEKARMGLRGFLRKSQTPLQIVVLTSAFILLLSPLGYLATSTLYLLLLFLWVSRYKLWAAAGLAIILGVGSWYFFGGLLAVQLPKGIWM